MLRTPDCLTCTLAAPDELDAGLAELDELLELQAVIRTAAVAAISGVTRILFRIIHSLSGMIDHETGESGRRGFGGLVVGS